MECLAYFTRLWKEREDNLVGNDFISMMIRGEATEIFHLKNILATFSYSSAVTTPPATQYPAVYWH